MSIHSYTSLTVSPGLTRPQQDPLHAGELFAIAMACAREFCPDYNDQQDLASEALLAALRYDDTIQFPRQFLRRTIRNICIDRSRSACAQELTGCEWDYSLDDLHTALTVESDDPCEQVILRDTLDRMECALSPAESRCYELIRQGYEQSDLPSLLRVSRQAVSRMIASIRRKYLEIEGVTN